MYLAIEYYSRCYSIYEKQLKIWLYFISRKEYSKFHGKDWYIKPSWKDNEFLN